MRLFFAAMLPPGIQRLLGKIRPALDWLPIRGNWSTPENLHITLKFLGEVPDDQVSHVTTAVTQALAPQGPISLRADNIVFLPPEGNARVLGIGFAGDTGRLTEIAQTIESAFEACNFPREARPFTPHATLARFRDGVRPVHRLRIEQSAAPLLARTHEFTLTDVQLMQSVLSSRGSTYSVAAHWRI